MRIYRKKWIEKNTSSLEGKTVAISGATGGIGAELCRYLAFLGASLILLDRNREKSSALKERLQKEFPSLSVSLVSLDLSDMSTVKAAAEALSIAEPDALILNAGAYHVPRYKCEGGLDNVFQINFAAPYYLVRELLPTVEKKGGRVVAVGSIAHNYSKIDERDIDFSTRSKSSLVYGNAKRFLMFSLYGLFEGSEGLAITHPGITFTNITAHYPPLIFAIIKHPMKVIFMKPSVACLSILRGLFEHTGKNEWIGPKVFNVWGMPKKKVLRTCDDTEAEKICAVAEDIFQKMRGDITTI